MNSKAERYHSLFVIFYLGRDVIDLGYMKEIPTENLCFYQKNFTIYIFNKPTITYCWNL